MKKKEEKTLNWDDFRSLGNPDNAPEEIIESQDEISIDKSTPIRILLDRKNRRGKSVSLILGLEDYNDDILKPIAKELKSICGVGGNVKFGEILIQGDHREKIIQYFIERGYKNTKKKGG